MTLIAVDIGGTFTDLMAFDAAKGAFYQAKTLSTPDDLVRGVIDCLSRSGLDVTAATTLIHGTTQAINTLIERKGAKTALVVTRGTRDAYWIGRGNRPEAYNLFFHRPRPLITRDLALEVDERRNARGEVIRPLDAEEVHRLCTRLERNGVEAVAICFLHSYADPGHEELAGDLVRQNLPGAYVCCSHEILREYREYERISTTVVNAYIGPRISSYIGSLKSRLAGIGFAGDLAIMQSNGGIMSPEVAARRPVMMIESGPVGGIIAAAETGRALGFGNVIAFDMGGTTAKASPIRTGQPGFADGYHVGGRTSGHPVMVPVVDVVEVGAGGGSIAWIDSAGALKVGPHSAGADPGPACYRTGGNAPTITDANVILGRIGADDFLGGEMPLDRTAAEAAMKTRIADPLGFDAVEAADAVVRIAVARMALAVREVSVRKGFDPRDFALVASGGAGPLHAVAIAREIHIPTVIVPRFPAHFSALGMLMADERHDFVRTCFASLEALDFDSVRAIYDELASEAKGVLKETGRTLFRRYMDLRYAGQEFTLTVPVAEETLRRGDVALVRAAFDRLHAERYAHHSVDEPIELVNLRLTALGRRPRPILPAVGATAAGEPVAHRPVWFDDSAAPVDCPVYRRETLAAGQCFAGPALIQEHASTTVMFMDNRCTVAPTGDLVISVGGKP